MYESSKEGAKMILDYFFLKGFSVPFQSRTMLSECRKRTRIQRARKRRKENKQDKFSREREQG